jgi:hypothetical protein
VRLGWSLNLNGREARGEPLAKPATSVGSFFIPIHINAIHSSGGYRRHLTKCSEEGPYIANKLNLETQEYSDGNQRYQSTKQLELRRMLR